MIGTAIGSNPIIFTTVVAMLYLSLIIAVPAKDDPIEAEKSCLNEVIQKYKVANSSVKVIYRGDSGDGHHIVNFDVVLSNSKTTTGICLVRISDDTVEIKEFVEIPDKN